MLFIGFGPLMGNLILLMLSYSMFLTLDMAVGIVYVSMVLMYIAVTVSVSLIDKWSNPV